MWLFDEKPVPDIRMLGLWTERKTAQGMTTAIDGSPA